MADTLEELAKKGRESPKSAAKRETRREERNDDFRRYLSERLVIKTFTQAHATRWLVPAFILVVVSAAGACSVFLKSEQMVTAFISLIVVGIIGGFILMRMSESVAVRAGTKWVASLPFTFQSAAYLEALSKPRSTSTMTVRIRFERPPAREERAIFADACAGAVEVAERGWKDDTLWVRTPGLATYFPARNDGEAYYSNAQLHKWFRSLVESALKPMHARAPISRVKVKVE
ncbi:MAG: hypothetical protein AB8H86_13745 [Polyangiales bacterium]